MIAVYQVIIIESLEAYTSIYDNVNALSGITGGKKMDEHRGEVTHVWRGNCIDMIDRHVGKKFSEETFE